MFVDIFSTDKKYNIIYADPPWKYGGGKNGSYEGLAVDQYPTMRTKDICALPARIVELKRLGHKITSEKGTSTNRFGKVHFNIYKLEEPQ